MDSFDWLFSLEFLDDFDSLFALDLEELAFESISSLDLLLLLDRLLDGESPSFSFNSLLDMDEDPDDKTAVS